eukprot:487778-Pleurochrysis_carterae.AAC.1
MYWRRLAVLVRVSEAVTGPVATRCRADCDRGRGCGSSRLARWIIAAFLLHASVQARSWRGALDSHIFSLSSCSAACQSRSLWAI